MKNSKDRRQENFKNASIGFVAILAAVAWVREGWRLSEYDTKQQMELAEAGGFVDKTAFLAAQAAGIENAEKWERLLTEMKGAGFIDPADFLMSREVGISQPEVWGPFKKAMIKDGFAKPKDYKEYRLTDFQSKDEFYEAKRLGSASRGELLGDLADEKFRTIDVGSGPFIAFCTGYASKAFEVVDKGRLPNKEAVSGVLTVVMARYLGNLVEVTQKDENQAKKLWAEWLSLGQQSGTAGFLKASSGEDNQSTEYLTFKKCMDNTPPLPDRFAKQLR